MKDQGYEHGKIERIFKKISRQSSHVLTHTEDRSQVNMFVQVLHIFRERIVNVTDEYRVVPASAIVAKSPALRGNFLPEEHLDLVNLKQNGLEQIDGTEKRRRLENTNVESKNSRHVERHT